MAEILKTTGVHYNVNNGEIGAEIWGRTTANVSLPIKVVDDGSGHGEIVLNGTITGGGGTEYTEGDTDASITGGAIMWEDTSDTLRAVSAAKPLPVNVVAGAAGGTQYTEADTDASITGTAIMWEDAADTLRAVSAAKPLPVIDTNSAAALTSLQLIDDVVQTTGSAVVSKTLLVGLRNSSGNQSHFQGGSTNADDVTPSSAGIHLNTAGFNYIFDGSNWDRMPGNSTDGTLVNLGANNDVTVTSGSITVTQGTGSNLHTVVDSGTITTVSTVTAVTTITNAVKAIGNVADDATTPGDPVLIGGSAVETDGTDPGSVSAEDDVARVRTDRNRRLLVNTAHPNLWKYNNNSGSAITDTEVRAAPGANLSVYVTDVYFSTEDANTFKLEDGDNNVIVPVTYLGSKGGITAHFRTPLRLTANKSLTYTTTVASNASILVSGFVAP